jgi:antitoxin component YwqK of YwqJK toxin-antitoxin module
MKDCLQSGKSTSDDILIDQLFSGLTPLNLKAITSNHQGIFA